MKDLDKFLNYAIAVVVIAIGASFFIFKKQPEAVNKSGWFRTVDDVDKVVNKHLQQTSIQNEVNKMRTERALEEARKKVLEDLELSRKKREAELQKVPLENQVWSESEIEKQTQKTPSTVKSVTPQAQPKAAVEQAEEFDPRLLSAEEKKEYAKQFIENAKKAGYKIELDENLEVIKTTPIRKPSQFEDSIDGYYND